MSRNDALVFFITLLRRCQMLSFWLIKFKVLEKNKWAGTSQCSSTNFKRCTSQMKANKKPLRLVVGDVFVNGIGTIQLYSMLTKMMIKFS